jgi:hypothetical protein
MVKRHQGSLSIADQQRVLDNQPMEFTHKLTSAECGAEVMGERGLNGKPRPVMHDDWRTIKFERKRIDEKRMR